MFDRTCDGGVFAPGSLAVAHVYRLQEDKTLGHSLPPAYPAKALGTGFSQFLRRSEQDDAPE